MMPEMKTRKTASISGMVAIANVALLTLVVFMGSAMHPQAPKGDPTNPFESTFAIAQTVLLFPVGWLVVLVPVLSLDTLLPWKDATAIGWAIFGGINALLWGKAVEAVVRRRRGNRRRACPLAIMTLMRKKMKRIGIIATVAWVIVLASLIARAVWVHHAVQASSASYTVPTPTVHRLLLIAEGRDVLLAVGVLIASVFVGRSALRAPAITLIAFAAITCVLWSASFITSVVHTDRTCFTMRPWSSAQVILFWHVCLEPGFQCLLAGIGLACGIMVLAGKRSRTEAEQTSPT